MNTFLTNPLRRAALFPAALAAFLLAFLAGCPSSPTPSAHPALAIPTSKELPIRWRVYAARRQSADLRLDLPVVVSGTTITFDAPVLLTTRRQLAARENPPAGSLLEQTAAELAAAEPATRPAAAPAADEELITVPATSWSQADNQGLTLYTTRIFRGAVEGPQVDQLTGQPRYPADTGSYLVPLPSKRAASSAGSPDSPPGISFEIKDPFPIVLRITVPPGADVGEYRFPVHITVPHGGSVTVDDALLAVEVADIALPTEPRVLALATTTVAALARIYPDTFGAITAAYLDRANPDHRQAVEQLDALVKTARRQGIALFVEDLSPALRVDELGQVALDWDAYDRVMQPYMDGTAFDDRVPMPVWLAPVPPRRIRDSATQLWQYIDACAKHFTAKGWVATPAFLHPALVEDTLTDDDPSSPQHQSQLTALRTRVADMMRLHMPRDMLAVTTPDAAGWGGPALDASAPAPQTAALPRGQLWTIDDADPRLPPAGALASEFSVRDWPWVCIARGNTGSGSPTGVRGFVWRNAITSASDLPAAEIYPLFVVPRESSSAGSILPSLRMSWLNQGLNDAALLGLLQKRADPSLINEILAGMVGRTGMTGAAGAPAAASSAPLPPLAPAGYLYSAWPGSRAAWNDVTPTLQKLILAHDPGALVRTRPDDPLYLAAQLWLSQTRRPVARIAGYSFSLRSGRESDIVDARIHLLIENPVDARADMDLHFTSLPGDFDMPPDPAAISPDQPSEPSLRRRSITLEPSAAAVVTLPIAGHVNDLMQAPGANVLELTERHAGAALRLPVRLPIYRTHAIDSDPSQTGIAPPKMDGHADDWPMDSQIASFGEMKVAIRYLSRPDMLAAALHQDDPPATVRWLYDKTYLYVLARCPQNAISDERNTTWPLQSTGVPGKLDSVRWWGSDGLQIELAPMPATAQADGLTAATAQTPDRLVKIAFKPAGIALIQTGQLQRDARGAASISWHDGPPSSPPGTPELKYGITLQKQDGRLVSYTVEAAIPRAWIDGPPIEGTRAPAWRVNILRHRALDLTSTSWSGPLVDDNDIAMLGALLGQ